MTGRSRAALLGLQQSPLTDAMPCTPNTKRLLYGLADLEPPTLAIMRGSSFSGDGATALRSLTGVFEEVLSDSGSRLSLRDSPGSSPP